MESKQLKSAICKARRYGLAFHVTQRPLFWMGTLAVPLLAMMIDMFKASCCPRVGQEKAFCVTIAIMVIMCSVIMCVCVDMRL
jgi:hypothetical protein